MACYVRLPQQYQRLCPKSILRIWWTALSRRELRQPQKLGQPIRLHAKNNLQWSSRRTGEHFWPQTIG